MSKSLTLKEREAMVKWHARAAEEKLKEVRRLLDSYLDEPDSDSYRDVCAASEDFTDVYDTFINTVIQYGEQRGDQWD